LIAICGLLLQMIRVQRRMSHELYLLSVLDA
jgi:hypothetical protein